MAQFKFRLTGVPPDQAIKMIETRPDKPVGEIKSLSARV